MMRRLSAIALLLAAAGCTPPAPSAPVADPNARRFVVFFQQWSAALDDPAQAAIRAAADELAAHPGERILVVGYADQTGSNKANDLLSALRAQVVTDGLVADGVASSLIALQGAGATNTLDSSQASRRVEIVTTR